MKAVFIKGIKAMVILFLFVMATLTVHAQFNIGGPGTNGSGTNANGTKSGGALPSVPFDGGMSLILLTSGIGYGARKLKANKNKLINPVQ